MTYCMRTLAACYVYLAVVAGSAEAQQKVPRAPIELRKAVEAGLKVEAAAATAAVRVAAIRELIALSKEVAAHPTFAPSAAVSLQKRIAVRLAVADKEIREHLAGRNAAAAREVAQGGANRDVLAQVAAPDLPLVDLPDSDGAAELADLIQEVVVPATWERRGGVGAIGVFAQGAAARNDVLAQVGGGAANGNRGQAGAPLALTENVGEELVALIQDVIAPQSWEVNGGAGVAVFLPGKNVLIVRQTDEVHEALFDVVGRMRRE